MRGFAGLAPGDPPGEALPPPDPLRGIWTKMKGRGRFWPPRARPDAGGDREGRTWL